MSWLKARGKDSPPDWGCATWIASAIGVLGACVVVLVKISSKTF